MRDIVIIAHNIRSCHNVGSLFRTADGMGVSKLYLTGYTPYPLTQPDYRLPHIANKLHKQIQKTALGAEETLPWSQSADIGQVLADLRASGFAVVGLEQYADSISLNKWSPPHAVALIVGSETAGLEPAVMKQCDDIVEIPMFGSKESFNVVQAAAIVLSYARFTK